MISGHGHDEMARTTNHESQRWKAMNIKSVSAIVLISVAVFLVISSFTTVTEGEEGSALFPSRKEPSGSTLTLLSVDVPQSGNLLPDIAYWTTIHFKADLKPEIRRACFSFSGGDQTCVDVQAKDVIYGSDPYFRVSIHVPAGSKRIDCYAEYVRDGRTQRTNTVTYRVIVMKPAD
jgi:hypothetical protein